MTLTLMYFRENPALHQLLLAGDSLLLIGAVLSLMLYQDRQGVKAVKHDRLALRELPEAMQPWSEPDSLYPWQGSGGLAVDPLTPIVEERACATHPSSSG